MRSVWFLAIVALSSSTQAQGPGFPRPRIPTGNPVTANKALLGKALFFEEQISGTRSMACATCHVFKAGGSDPRSALNGSIHPGPDGRLNTGDDRRGSRGVVGSQKNGSYKPAPTFGLSEQITDRRAMTVINSAFAPSLFWDGRASGTFRDPANGTTVLLSADAALESQAAAPPVNSVEMAHFGETWADVANRVAKARPLRLASNIPTALANFIANKSYPDLFQAAFGSSAVTPARIAMAIATYERTLISDQSPWDSFVGGNQRALTQQQQRGRGVFFNRATRCANCHRGPLFTDDRFHYTGVRPGAEDIGRETVTRQAQDRGRMRTPSLRNVALRAPYLHNGMQKSLADVVAFYNRGGDFNAQNKNRDIRPLRLSSAQQADLVAFLQALTDPRVAAETAPFDRPTLYSESNRTPLIVGWNSPGSGWVEPQIIAHEPPATGNPNFTIGVHKGLGGAPAILVLDTNAVWTPIALAGARMYLPLSPAMMLVPAGTLLGTGNGNGYTSFSTPLPNDPKLIGTSVGVQWVLGDSGLGQLFSSTAAAQIKLF